MFSYLQTVQTLVDEAIFRRGQREYLEGKVGQFRELTLDFWREYTVNSQETYKVRLPLLHLALAREKWPRASEALYESGSCECLYFQSNGFCRHLVAVCASLEQEFNKREKIPQVKNEKGISGESLLETIFAATAIKKKNVWLSKLEQYLRENLSDFQLRSWLEEMSAEVAGNKEEYKDFWQTLAAQIASSLKKWENERNLADLAINCLLTDSLLWWPLWQKLLPQFKEQIQSKLWLALFTYRENHQIQKIWPLLEEKMQGLEDSLKEKILQELVRDFGANFALQALFALKSHYFVWLKERLGNLDPLFLLQLATVWPQEQFKLEQLAASKLRTWSDFLVAGEYEELLKVLHFWQLQFTDSEYLAEIIKYVRSSHGRKAKLMQSLENLF